MFNDDPFAGPRFADRPIDVRGISTGIRFAGFTDAANAAVGDWWDANPVGLTAAFDDAEAGGSAREIELSLDTQIDFGGGVTRTIAAYASPFGDIDPNWRITVLDDGSGRPSMAVAEAINLPGAIRAEAVAHGVAKARGGASPFVGVARGGALSGTVSGGAIQLDDLPAFVADGTAVVVMCWDSFHATCN